MNIFSEQKNNSELISKNEDTDKFQKIVSILCEKRKNLEEALSKPEQPNNNEMAQTLLELVEEMRTFGISEIDYQKYLAQQDQNTAQNP